MRKALLLSPLLLLAAAPPQDPVTDPSCASVRVALPPELAGWSERTPVSAGVKPGDGATVEVGKAAQVSLHPAKHLALAPAPARPAGDDTSGGTLGLAITAAGSYRVALGGGVWVDLVKDGKAIASTAHGHGPKCTGVRKMVDFKLVPGNYVIQLSGGAADSVSLMVAKL